MRGLKSVQLLLEHGSIKKALKSIGLNKKPSNEEIKFFWLKLCEERYKYDFEFFAATCQKLVIKETGEIKPFIFNLCQRDFHANVVLPKLVAGEEILAEILKAKQQGFSTYVEALFNYIQTIHKENWNSVICGQVRDTAVNIRAMYKTMLDEMPPIKGVKMTMRGFESAQNIQYVPERGCRIILGFAGEPENLRSHNFKLVHLSEEAFYPDTDNNNPKKIEGTLNSSRSHGAFCAFIRESTANGVGGFFYDQWQKAKAGATAFTAHFSAWYNSESKEIAFDGGYYQHNGKKKKGSTEDFIETMNDYEINLWKNNKRCTLENLNWYRLELATSPSIEIMRQENPSDDIEAFQNSGIPAFNHELVRRLYDECCAPVEVGEFVSDCAPEIAFVDTKRRSEVLKNIRFVPDAELAEIAEKGDADTRRRKLLNKIQIWEQPDKEQRIENRYIVVFDPQKGQSDGADYGVIKVLDRYWRMYGEGTNVVAMFYGHKNMYVTIWIAAQLAKYYNDALLVVESNTYDSNNNQVDFNEYIFETIKDHYDNLYKYKTSDKSKNNQTTHYGFPMLRETKSAIISNYNQILDNLRKVSWAYGERDRATVDEALTYECKKNGGWGAIAGKHDDRIMATMIGLYIDYQMELPRKAERIDMSKIKKERTAW
ncbi:MAG: hypothetical protein LBN27_05035 [Prevotellaceae bacterium]|jgi:hypothetical protein|nr:hypothetical protein [Prevotellaceae bacterium]